MKNSFPGVQSIMAELSDAERDLAWTEVEQQLSEFERSKGFETPREVLVGVGTK
jgi:hypothetical protein